MAILAITRDYGVNVSIVRLTSTDTLAAVSATGYLTAQAANITAANHGTWTWLASDTVDVYASDGHALFNLSGNFSTLVPVAAPGEVTYTPPVTVGHFAVWESTSGDLEDGGVQGTASHKDVSDNGEPLVASISGATTIGNLAVFADTFGTVSDGGPVPTPGTVAPGQSVFAATNGSDTTGDGSLSNPFLTYGKAISTVVSATSGVPFVVFLYPGVYYETDFLIKPYVSVVGIQNALDITGGSYSPVQIMASGTMLFDPSYTNAGSSLIANLDFNGNVSLDATTYSAGANVYFQNINFSNNATTFAINGDINYSVNTNFYNCNIEPQPSFNNCPINAYYLLTTSSGPIITLNTGNPLSYFFNYCNLGGISFTPDAGSAMTIRMISSPSDGIELDNGGAGANSALYLTSSPVTSITNASGDGSIWTINCDVISYPFGGVSFGTFHLTSRADGINAEYTPTNYSVGTNDVRAQFVGIDSALAPLVSLGTAADKAASDNAQPDVASVVVGGGITVGHVAVFADTSGSIEDGGPAPSSPWSVGAGTDSVKGGDGTEVASGNYSLSFGNNTNQATGLNSFAFGNGCWARFDYDFAFGNETTAGLNGGVYSMAFGNQCLARNSYSMAFGNQVTATNQGAFVLGDSTGTNNTDSTRDQFVATYANGFYLYGQVHVSTVGKGLAVAEGSNAKQGTISLTAGVGVVANTSVTANSRIFYCGQDTSVTGFLTITARSAGSGFTITSSVVGDTGVVAYEIFEPA